MKHTFQQNGNFTLDARFDCLRRENIMSETVIAQTQPGPVFRVELAPSVFGLTRKACEGKIYRGDWVQGREYHRAPDGTIWLDKAGVQRWVTGVKA